MLTWKPAGRPSLSATLGAERRRVERSAILLLLGVLSVLGAGLSDLYIHRGYENASGALRLQPIGREQGTNIDLRRFPADDLDQVLSVVASGGLTHVRQVFSWSEIEPTQGAFEWGRYDAIVAATEAAGVEAIAVLADTPEWARDPAEIDFADAPPRSTAAFEAFCTALRQRYATLHYFQIGQALDDPARWGGRVADPNEYAALLTVASEAFLVDATDSYLIAGDISSTSDARRTGADLDAIRRVLGDSRVNQLVDVVAIVADGGSSSPYDRRTSDDVHNLSRTVLLRAALVDVGYGDVSIWLSRLGWTGVGEDGEPAVRQAELVGSALHRVRSEWAWVDLVLAWEFLPDEDSVASPGLSLVDGKTPTPVYTAYAEFAATPFGGSATVGLNAADSPACDFTGEWPEQHLQRQLSRVSRDPEATATCRFWGSGLSIVSRYSPSSGSAWFRIDGQPSGTWPVDSGWSVVPLEYTGSTPVDTAILLATDLDDGPHTLTIRLAAGGELVFGGIIVRDSRAMVWPVGLLLVSGILALMLALREVATVLAEHLDILQRRRGVVLQPALPRLSTWEPAARLRGRR